MSRYISYGITSKRTSCSISSFSSITKGPMWASALCVEFYCVACLPNLSSPITGSYKFVNLYDFFFWINIKLSFENRTIFYRQKDISWVFLKLELLLNIKICFIQTEKSNIYTSHNIFRDGVYKKYVY